MKLPNFTKNRSNLLALSNTKCYEKMHPNSNSKQKINQKSTIPVFVDGSRQTQNSKNLQHGKLRSFIIILRYMFG